MIIDVMRGFDTMIFEKIKKIVAVICLVAFVVSMSACSEIDPNADDGIATEDEYISSEPSVGIGREENTQEMTPIEENGIVICIDPGHGFWDGGCGEGILPDGILEKDINLAIANFLRGELEMLGYDTIMTHDGATFPKSSIDDGNQKYNPNERVAYANTLDIDYYISIHVNSYDADTSIRGLRIYFTETAKKSLAISEEVAVCLGDAVYLEFPDDKKPVVIDQTGDTSFAVVRETVAPASLVEVGFATNPEDAANMVNTEWQKRVAKALARGIDAHFAKVKDGE